MSAAIIWSIIGFGLLVAEMFTLTFILLFFGVAALVIALLAKFGIVVALVYQIVIFALIGLSGIFLLRNKILVSIQSKKELAGDVQQKIVLSHDIAPHGEASVNYQGTIWKAYNDSPIALKKGDSAVILRTEGVKLVIQKA